MKFEIGDYVKGITDDYGITNTFMKKGIVTDTKEKEIKVKVLEHEHGKSGTFWVLDSKFEKIGHAEMFDRDKFLELMEESKEKAVEYLSDADLSGADLSGADLSDADLRRANLSGANLSDAKGILDAINYLEANFEKTEEGYIVYKTFGENYCAPDTWKIEPGEIIEETANPDRGTECGCGINVAPLNWVRRNSRRQPYKLLIRWEWLPGVVVPFSTDGKIRCSKAQILGITDH